MTKPMLPPPPDCEPLPPPLVEWDASTPAWNELADEQQTWRAGSHSSAPPEAA